jgi:hypothetical protein
MNALTPENTEADDDGISSAFAARLLSGRLGDAEFIWMRRLANWRKPDRKQPIPWIERSAGHPRYQFADVIAFAEAELAKRPPTIAAATESDRAKSAAVPDVEDGRSFVRVLWNAGTAQGAYSLTIEAAETFAKSVAMAADKARAIQMLRGEPA